MPESKRGFVPEDIEQLQTVADPQVDAGGKRTVYVVTDVDTKADTYRSHLWIAPLGDAASGSRPRQLTRGNGRDSSPQWSPDGGRIVFARRPAGSAASEKAQLWLIDPDGGEPWQLSDLPGGASDPVWSPDGTQLAFLSRTAEGEAETEEKDKTPAQKHAPRVVRDLVFRLDGRGLYDDKHSHIWLIPAAGGEARQITSGDWDDADIAWSPNGREIAFTSYREADRGARRIRDVWVLTVESGELRKLTQSRGPSNAPVWSPDGRTIAYAGHQYGDEGARTVLLYAIAAEGGEARPLTSALDRSVAAGPPMGRAIVWAPDGASIVFLAQNRGVNQPYRVAAGGGEARPIGRIGGYITSICLTPDGQSLITAASDPSNPGDLFQFSVASGAETQLTHQNAAWLAGVLLNEPEEIRYSGADGWEMHGWLLKPVGYREGQRYPLVLQIHGGPHGQHGLQFQAGFQELSARGYAVLFLNPRGSIGYGEDFCRACVTDWGGKDYEDLMLGVDWAIAEGIADPERLFVTGYSYGGFMTSWVVGHTDRFKAAVCGAPVSNAFSFYGASDIGAGFGHFEFGGPPWERESTYREHSPITFIHRCETPLLLIHWEGDLRCPIGQSEEIFAILRKLGRECLFVRYPGGFHTNPTWTPSQRVDFLRRTSAWFDEHLIQSASAKQEAATVA